MVNTGLLYPSNSVKRVEILFGVSLFHENERDTPYYSHMLVKFDTLAIARYLPHLNLL